MIFHFSLRSPSSIEMNLFMRIFQLLPHRRHSGYANCQFRWWTRTTQEIIGWKTSWTKLKAHPTSLTTLHVFLAPPSLILSTLNVMKEKKIQEKNYWLKLKSLKYFMEVICIIWNVVRNKSYWLMMIWRMEMEGWDGHMRRDYNAVIDCGWGTSWGYDE